MAERVRKCCCYSCIHLQRENPIVSGEMALYRCTSQKRNGRCVGWVQKDKPDVGLRAMGGSCCNKIYPGDKIEQKSFYGNNFIRYLYCGKFGENKYLLYRAGNNGYADVGKTFFRGQTGHISSRIRIVQQNPEQLEASKRIAKKRKARWSERNGKSSNRD